MSNISQLSQEELTYLRWHKGALKFLTRPHQHSIYDALWSCINDPNTEHTSHVINASRQLGKSFTETVVAVEFCIRNPKSTVLFVAPLRSQAEEIIMGETYFRIFETCPTDLKPKLEGNTIKFPNGSRIRLGGTDNRRYEDLRGGAAHLLILDEAGFMAHLDDGVLPALQPMLNSTRGKTIYSSTPPPNVEHPYTAIYRDHQERGFVSHFTIFDNSHLDEADIVKAYLETGSKMIDGKWVPSTRFRREYLAEHVMEGTVLIARDWDDEFVVERKPNEYHQFHHRYVALDPGVTDNCATLFAYYDHIDRHLHIVDELTHGGNLLKTEDLAADIRKTLDNHWPGIKPYRFVADNNNPHLIQDLKLTYNLPFVPTSKTRLESTRASMEEGMVNKLNTWLRQGRISVHPRCEQLIGCLRYGTWKETGQNRREFDHSRVYGHYDHLAALVYLVRNIDERTNPVPITHGFTSSTFHIPTPQVANPSLHRLGDALRPRNR